MRLLVAGADRVDAGKTTFSTGLCARVGATGFKPRAGNDFWFDHDDYEACVGEGRLYGKDARRLAAASAAAVTPEEINPVHRLWRPLPGSGTGFVGAGHRQFVCDRVGETYVVNAEADVPASAREGLALADAVEVASVQELNAAMKRLHLPALASLADRVRGTERAVVESYADIARPVRDLSVDAVAVVEPGRARVYDGDRYARACEATSGSARDGRMERRVGDVVEYLDLEASVSLPALSAAEREDPDAVADAYEVAYDALFAAAL